MKNPTLGIGLLAASVTMSPPLVAQQSVAGTQSVIDLARSRAGVVSMPAGAEQRTIKVGDVERNYWLLRPSSARSPSPVVFVLHGGAVADGRQTLRYDFQTLGTRDGVVTVHPSGVGAGWNDGRDTSFLLDRSGAVDDVAFFRSMIDSLISEGIADPKQIYVTGGSNGGMMTMRLACDLGEKLAGVAPFVAQLPAKMQDRCAPTRSVPMQIIVGTADRMMPFMGGGVAAMSGDDRGTVLSAAATMDFWRRQYRCSETVIRENLADTDPNDGTRVRVERAQGCAVPLEMVIVEGGGHRLPGEGPREYNDPRISALSGVSSRDVSGRDLIWNFFFAAPDVAAAVSAPPADPRRK